MNKLIQTLCVGGVLTSIAACPSLVLAAVTPSGYSITVSGVFDYYTYADGLTTEERTHVDQIVDQLMGTRYTSSFTVGALGSDANRSAVSPDRSESAWSFASPYTNSLTTNIISYSLGSGSLVHTSGFYYDGTQGVIPAGEYTELAFVGWMRDPGECSGQAGSLLGDPTEGCPGDNWNPNFGIVGSTSMFSSITEYPLTSLDFGEAIYGFFDLRLHIDGHYVATIGQDPLLTYSNGVLSGENMVATIRQVQTNIPEPTSLALLVMGMAAISTTRSRSKTG